MGVSNCSVRLKLVLWFYCILFCSSPSLYALEQSASPAGSNALALHQLNFTGEDVNIALLSAGNCRRTNEAFYNKDEGGFPLGSSNVINYDFTTVDQNDFNIISHDTWVAGIIASKGGRLYPSQIGIAPAATIHSARIVNSQGGVSSEYITDALDELIINQNCRVIVTGIALIGIEPDGQNFFTMLYDYYADLHDIVFANPAANSGSNIEPFGDAYNGITTGGLILDSSDTYSIVGLLSGSGPTSDLRRKPDVTAPSQSQTVPTAGSDTSWSTVGSSSGETSFSAPHTAGVAALLIDYAQKSPQSDDHHAQVIKAVIVNSTFPNISDKSAVQTNPADPNNTWHPERGYGRIDALRAYQQISSPRITPDTVTDARFAWAFENIESLQPQTYTITVPKNARLIATLSWNRKIKWNDKKQPVSGRGIIEYGELETTDIDLDLKIFKPADSNEIFSQDLFGLNPNDNLEKADLLITQPGDYTLEVSNKDTETDIDYALAIEILPPLTADFPPLDYIVDINDLLTLTQNWLIPNPQIHTDIAENNNLVNLNDLAALSDQWQKTKPAYHQKK